MAEVLRIGAGYFPVGGSLSHGGTLTVTHDGLQFDPHRADRALTGSRALRVDRSDIARVEVLARQWRPVPGFSPRRRMIVHLRSGGSLVFLFNRFSDRFQQVRTLLA